MRPVLHAGAIALSAALLFLVEPMVAKAFLPWFGGAAGVWVACVLFFQLTLLAGYAYAFVLTRFIPLPSQRVIHIALVVAAAALLRSATPSPQNIGGPTCSIVISLAISIGLPFFVLSATSPLVQTWYAADPSRTAPYRLFALSNAASLGALLAYPIVIEPSAALATQFRDWAWCFLLFGVLIAACAAIAPRGAPKQTAGESLPSWPLALWWIALAAGAAAMWPALANYLGQEVAPIPFLWVLPLATYLLSFILCFESAGWYRPRAFRFLLPVACAAFAWRLASGRAIGGIVWEIPILLAALFICCMFCHGELAALKPPSGQGLAYFYWMVALGGAAGAAFVAVLAPNLFDTYLELPVAVAAAAILGMRLLFGIGSPRVLLRWCLVGAMAFLIASRYTHGRESVYRERNFYGALQVIDAGSGPDAVRLLYHGKILHGAEFLAPGRAGIPTAYYSPQSGVAAGLASIKTPNRRVGIVGLGSGTIAAYGRPGDHFDFYDINPAVIDVSHTYFHFLDQSQAQVATILADGRMAIAREPAASYDALVLDAFSGDSIPVHLLTREAFGIYLNRLKSGGVLMVHVTNRYLNIADVVRSAARATGRPFRIVHNDGDPAAQSLDADWALIDNTRSQSAPAPHSKPAPWTDEYSSVFAILK